MHLHPIARALGLAATLAGLASLAAPPAHAQPTIEIKKSSPIVNPGWLYLDTVMPEAKAQARGLVRPLLYVYEVDDAQKTGSRIGGGGYPPGESVPLAEGWYDVEIAHFPDVAPGNKHRYYVKAGQVTVVQSGMLSLQALPESEQLPDVCRSWNAAMTVLSTESDPEGHKHLVLMAGNGAHVKDQGLLQLHPGTYLVEWNGLCTQVEVTAGQITPVQTGFVGPFRGKDKPRIHQKEGESGDNPVIAACDKQPTQVLVGSFWLSYPKPEAAPEEEDPNDTGVVSMTKAPRVFEPLVVDAYRAEKPEKLGGDRLKGYTIYKGEGSTPDHHLR